MTVPELEDALVEFIEANTSEMRFKSNTLTDEVVPPQVYTAFVPRNQVGEIEPGEITNYPAIIVRARQGVQSKEYERVTVELLIGIWDNTRDQQGSRDVLNIIERIKQRLREQNIIRQRFPIRMPLNWQINKRQTDSRSGDYNAWPYFFGEMQIDFELRVMSTHHEADTMTPDLTEGRFNVPFERRDDD